MIQMHQLGKKKAEDSANHCMTVSLFQALLTFFETKYFWKSFREKKKLLERTETLQYLCQSAAFLKTSPPWGAFLNMCVFSQCSFNGSTGFV